MRRLHVLCSLVVAVALVLAVAASASAEPWPAWGATQVAQPGTGNVYEFAVSKTAIDTGWRFTVTLADEAWYGADGGAKAFIVYLDGLDARIKYDAKTNPDGIAQGWNGYGTNNTAPGTWTNTNGGWEWNKYPGATDTTAAFGWQTGGPPGYLKPGQSYTFDAVGLPAATSFHYALHIDPQGNGSTYWQREGSVPPVPEPASLALLAIGLVPFAVMRRRRT